MHPETKYDLITAAVRSDIKPYDLVHDSVNGSTDVVETPVARIRVEGNPYSMKPDRLRVKVEPEAVRLVTDREMTGPYRPPLEYIWTIRHPVPQYVLL